MISFCQNSLVLTVFVAKRKVDTLKVNKYNRVFVGFCFFVASIVFSLSIISYSPLDNSLSTVSAEAVRNWLGRPGAILSDLLIQIFGLYSFVIVIALFIWGIRSLHDKIKYIKRKCTAFVLSIITGTILLTVFASSFFGEILVKKFHVPYLLGGSLGYVLTKLTFVESQLSSSVVKYVTAIVFVLFLFVLKKTLFIRFSAIQFDIRGLKKLLWPRIKRNMVNPKKDKGPESEFIPSFINTKEPIEPKEETINITNEKRIAEVMMAGSIGAYTLPSVDLLDLYQSSNKSTETADIVSERASELTSVLEEFGIKGEIINVKQGPIVTMFEFRPAPGVKTSRVISLSDDIARSMSAISTRIATIPGQNAIGIELPNKTRQTVFLRDLLSSSAFADSLTGIPIVLGKDISGLPIMADLAKMPHLLVAGTTGSGKSVSINAMILSILFRFTSDQCKLIMIDPKMLEL
jgi:S-DNA-T family DNA segregation ATPase FtsK/SpoIIIE